MVIMDTTNQAELRNSAETLRNFISPLPSFDCKNLREVKAELDQARESNREKDDFIKTLLKELTRMERESGVKSAVDVCKIRVKKSKNQLLDEGEVLFNEEV